MNLTLTKIFSLITFLLFASASFAQAPIYKVKYKLEIPLTLGSGGLSYAGNKLLKDNNVDSARIASFRPDQISRFNRGAVKYYYGNAQRNSDIALYTSIALPSLLFFSKRIRNDALPVSAIYLESISLMTLIYTWILVPTQRPRPFMYNRTIPIDVRMRANTKGSFLGGHPAVSAVSSFFMAKVVTDYYFNGKPNPFVLPLALIPPVTTGYFRYKAGKHFPTDIIGGIVLGGIIGFVIPQFHKNK